MAVRVQKGRNLGNEEGERVKERKRGVGELENRLDEGERGWRRRGGGERERRGEGKGREGSWEIKWEEVHGSARHTHREGKWRSLSSGALCTF